MKKVNLTVIQKARPMDADLHLAYEESISREALRLIRGGLGATQTTMQEEKKACDAVCLPPGYGYCSCYHNLV
ncbi:MAG: hypothetical protein K1W14_04235 [Muribaculaceae bacterium]